MLLLIGVLIGVFVVDVRLGAALAGYCVLVAVGMVIGQRLAVPSGTRARAADAALFGHLEEALAGAEDIRGNGAAGHLVSRFYRSSAAVFRAENRAARVGTSVMAGTSVAFAAGTATAISAAAAVAARIVRRVRIEGPPREARRPAGSDAGEERRSG